MKIKFGWAKNAGLITLYNEPDNGLYWCIHFLVSPEYRTWWKTQDEFEKANALYNFGLGPLLLITWFYG